MQETCPRQNNQSMHLRCWKVASSAWITVLTKAPQSDFVLTERGPIHGQPKLLFWTKKKKKDPAGRGVRFFQASHSNTSKANEFVKQSMVNVSFLSQHSSHCVQQVKRITSCLPHCYGMHAQPALKQMLQKQIYVRCKKQGWRCKHEEKGQHMNTSEPRQVCFSAVTT